MDDCSNNVRVQDENTPLLSSSEESGATTPCAKCVRPIKQWLVLIVGFAFILLIDLGGFLGAPAQTQIFENIICRHHYAQARHMPQQAVKDLDEAACKIDPVQTELAFINGWKDTFDVLPGILFSLPYGVMADHIGRKPVLLLGLFGCLLSETWSRIICWWPGVFPIRLVWLSALWKTIGGGEQVVAALACVIVADIFSEEERATALFRITSAALIAEILGTPTSAGLMISNPWIPYLLSVGIMGFGGILALLLPETVYEAREKTRKTEILEDDSEELDHVVKQQKLTTIIEKVHEFFISTRFIFKETSVLLSLFTFFVATLTRGSTNLLLQYISKKYHWTIAESSFLISTRGAINLLNYLVLMPLLSYFLTNRLHMPAALKDLRLTQTSGLFTSIGFFIIFMAGTPEILLLGIVTLSLGSAFAIASRSFAISLVLPDHVATFYSAATVVQCMGALFAGPSLASIFSFSMKLGSSWLGLPFLGISICYLVACVAISCIRMGRRARRSMIFESERDSLLNQ